jgi:hypothetical protein
VDVKDSLSGTQSSVDTATRVAVVSSLVALFFSGWSLLVSMDDDNDVRQVEQRLACLELPGANDCGVDGR